MAATLITVIMGVKNAQEFLNTAIDSLLLQTHKNFEIIVVDYGSSDQTGSIVNHYSDKRIRYIASQHTYLEDALNYAAQEAKGELLVRMDQADHAHPERFNKQATYLLTHPHVGLVATNFEYIDEDGSFIDRGATQNTTEDLNPQVFLKNPLAHGTLMMRKDVFTKAGGYKTGEATESYDFWKRVGMATDICYLPEILYRLRVETRKQAIGVKTPKKNVAPGESYRFWLQVARSYPEGVRLSGETTPSDDTSLVATCEVYIQAAKKIWANGGLTNTQRWLLEEEIYRLNTEWSSTKNTTNISPSVSVVMGVYNASKYVAAAVNSILGQTFKNFEFIIIDDGSTDDSVAIIEAINDPRIRIISQANHGLVYSLNKGVGLARSSLIARMDADDISMPSRFEKELAVMALNKRLGLISGFFAYMDEYAQPTSGLITAPTKHLDLRRSMYINNPFAHGCTMYRKEAFDQAGGYRDTYGPTEDYDLWRRIADCEWELAQIPDILYLYRLNPGGISSENNEVQQQFAEAIVHEQWKKPFVYKGYSAIVKDGLYYKNQRSQFSELVYNQYTHQQFLLTKELYARGWLKRAFITGLGTARLDRRRSYLLTRLMFGGILRRAGLRNKITD